MQQKDSSLLMILVSVFLLSACALAYEILLMRLFSIIQWHHFAYMVIGLALLGYGASGTIVSLFQRQAEQYFHVVYISCVLLFAVFSMISYQIAQEIPFNAEVVLWDNRQLLYLVALMLLLSLPFFFVASAICLAFIYFRNSLSSIYAADLVGAAAGSLLIVLSLFWLEAHHALLAIALLATLSVIPVLPQSSIRHARRLAVFMLAVMVIIAFNAFTLQLNPSPYKSLNQAMQVQGAEVIYTDSSPYGMLTVVKNDLVPFRHAPGLSFNASQEILQQLGLFTDAGNAVAINRYPQNKQALSYLSNLTSAAAYVIGQPASTLVVGSGGGTDLLQAIYFEVEDIDALEINPQVVELVNTTFGDYSGHLYSHESISTYIDDVRGFLDSTMNEYALIQLNLTGGGGNAAAGMHALNEGYLYTTEALNLYLDHVDENGLLSITRWLSLPPRDSLKLFHTVVTVLKSKGIENIEQHIAFIRSWQTGTILVRKTPFPKDHIEQLRRFNEVNGFDAVWLPGMQPSEANRVNRLSSAVFHEAALAMLDDESRAGFIESYKFDLEVATDDRPYFHHYFRWSTFQELLALRNQGAMPLMEWGYLILVASLVIAVVASLLLIMAPLFLLKNKPDSSVTPVSRLKVIYYFFAIGIAFLMIEIAFMQKFILLLHHPIYSFSSTLAIFLLFAGTGSFVSGRLLKALNIKQVLLISCLGIGLIGVSYLWLLGQIFDMAASLQTSGKILLSVALLGPLAFFMGMPFPTGLSLLTRTAGNYVPWAWGINGCASVISASLSTLLAIELGFNAVITLGLALYLSTLLFFPFSKTPWPGK